MKNLTNEKLAALAERFGVNQNTFNKDLKEWQMVDTILVRIAMLSICGDKDFFGSIYDIEYNAILEAETSGKAAGLIRKGKNAVKKALEWFKMNDFKTPISSPVRMERMGAEIHVTFLYENLDLDYILQPKA